MSSTVAVLDFLTHMIGIGPMETAESPRGWNSASLADTAIGKRRKGLWQREAGCSRSPFP